MICFRDSNYNNTIVKGDNHLVLTDAVFQKKNITPSEMFTQRRMQRIGTRSPRGQCEWGYCESMLGPGEKVGS